MPEFSGINSQEIHKLTVSKAYNLEMAVSLFYFFSAFTKKLKHNSQEYVLELVDTAGQVNMMCSVVFGVNLIMTF